MQEMSLSKKQKEKLLEMCEVLFPEHAPFDLELESQYDGSQYQIIFQHMKKDMFSINWFEFCLTYLQDKIKSAGGFEYNIDCDVELISCWFESHPVDYLYQEFKKLNK